MSWPTFWLKTDWRTHLLAPLGKWVCYLAAQRLKRFQKSPPESPGLVLVVGNLVVGGSGKTPFIIWLGRELIKQGLKVGVISRGYGGQAKSWPQVVTPESDPALVGDEPVLLAQVLGCPVVVAPKRAEALAMINAQSALDLVISDDGLQHYTLARDIEVVLLDTSRPNFGLGNGLCLPAGPLREPVKRLEQVDFVVLNGADSAVLPNVNCRYLATMQIKPTVFYQLTNPENQRPIDAFAGQTGYAVAGIGNPARFYQTLSDLAITPQPLAFSDHHAFQAADFIELNPSKPLFMTRKDAVKCQGFAQPNWWVLDIEPDCDAHFKQALLNRIHQVLQAKPRQHSSPHIQKRHTYES
jgi:tetraacyldisaccharide 4'-kinase